MNDIAKELAREFARIQEEWLRLQVKSELARCRFGFDGTDFDLAAALVSLGWQFLRITFTHKPGVELTIYAPGNREIASRYFAIGLNDRENSPNFAQEWRW